MRLTVSAREGLVLVVPAGWRGDAGAVVGSKRQWAERALARVAERRAQVLSGAAARVPEAVELPALGAGYAVRCAHGARSSVREVAHTLTVSGPSDDARLKALLRWVDRTARTHLPARVAHLAEQHGFEYSACRVRRARSRWGSCSSAGTISLNRNLVFLPPHLVDALILHELVHTRVFDHSERFWATLAAYDPQALAHRRALKGAGQHVPVWADA